MKTNLYLILTLFLGSFLSNTQAKDLHCYLPFVGRTRHCESQAEIDRLKREAKAEAKTLKREARAQANTIKTEAKEQAKQTVTAAKEYKKATEAQAKAIKNETYPQEERHWYNLWRFWDIKPV